MITASSRIAGVEELLAGCRRIGCEFAREGRHEAGARKTAGHAVAHPKPRRAHALGRGQHDADDEPGLDDFAKNNEKGGEHVFPFLRAYFAIRDPLVWPWKSSKKPYVPAFSGPI